MAASPAPSSASTAVTADLLAFIAESPSPFHAAAAAARRLASAGFTEADPGDPAAPGRWFIAAGGSLVAWVDDGASDPSTPFRIVGAHTDSPNLRIKPQPDVDNAGYRQLGVEVYGGVLLNSWLDRDLGLSGRVAVRRSAETLDYSPDVVELRLFRHDEPLLRVPQLAIHLDRKIHDDGLKLNKQEHMAPIWGLGEADGTVPEERFRTFLAEQLSADGDPVEADAILSWDLMTHDLTPGALLGRHQEFYATARIDNLCSVHSGVEALIAACAGGSSAQHIPVVVCFDHEEVGSVSATGAGSPTLLTLMERSVGARGGNREDFHQACAVSHAVSCDGAHATHPNYADRHEPNHNIALNGGPVLKNNANQRYATDAQSAGPILQACREAEVPVQRFVTRTDLPCGSTIGPLTAATAGIPVVDFGAPQLSMHSARELGGTQDPAMLLAALTAYLR